MTVSSVFSITDSDNPWDKSSLDDSSEMEEKFLQGESVRKQLIPPARPSTATSNAKLTPASSDVKY